MTIQTLTAAFDTYVDSAAANANYSGGNRVRVKSGSQLALLNIPVDVRGSTVLAADLTLHAGNAAAAHTLTVTPIAASWNPRTVTWNTKPSLLTAQAFTVSVPALASGQAFTLSMLSLMQSVAAGQDWFGVQLATSSTASIPFVSAEAGGAAWSLALNLSDAPDIPSDLAPDSGAVSTTKPSLSWTFDDVGGESSTQGMCWVQFSATGNFASPDWDSGWVTTTLPMLDLSTTTFPGLTGTTTYWRVAVADGAGLWSAWSDPASVSYLAKPAVVMDSPTGGTVGDPTFPVQAHLASGTVARWQIQLFDLADPSKLLMGAAGNGALSYVIPATDNLGRAIFHFDHSYRLKVWLWQSGVTRANGVIGDPSYSEAVVDFAFATTLTVPTPTSLDWQQVDGGPRITWTWQATVSPDAWLLTEDGKQVARLTPDQVAHSGGWYSWTDAGTLRPLHPHKLGVQAISNGDVGDKLITHCTPEVAGVWIVDGDWTAMLLQDAQDWSGSVTYPERRVTYQTLDAGADVDIVYGTAPITGQFEGLIESSTSDVLDVIDHLEGLRDTPWQTVRLVWGSRSELVRLNQIDVHPTASTIADNLLHSVRFGFKGA